MDDITEKTIIEAIINLDSSKLQEIVKSLKDRVLQLTNDIASTDKVIKALRAADFEDKCTEFHNTLDTLRAEFEYVNNLLSRCYGALNVLRTKD